MAELEEISQEDFEVLHENSAQDIFNNLRELESDRETHERRWPWELLQNAADAAKPEGVDCTFELTGDNVVFIHSGKPFTKKEISHLIHHGSTKTDETGKTRFGTGFITTHLLSKNVDVSGLLDVGKTFGFPLDRSGSDWHELERNMYKASKDFRNSIKPPPEPSGSVFTKFAYHLPVRSGTAVQRGLQALRDNVHIVLALNIKLNSIRIIDSQSDVTWKRAAGGGEKVDNLRVVQVERSLNNKENRETVSETYSVALAAEGQVTVAVLLQGSSSNFEVSSMACVPKLYYEFPLATTETFPCPGVIVSPSFVPRNERDGLLWGKDEGSANSENKSLVEKGYKLFLEVARTASKHKWGGLQRLASIGGPFIREGLDGEWLNKTCKTIVEEIRQMEMLEGIQGEDGTKRLLVPKSSLVPFDSDSKVTEEIWNLGSALLREKLPSKLVIHEWARILSEWGAILGYEPTKLQEALPLGTLVSYVSKLSSLNVLSANLKPNPPPQPQTALDWLNALYAQVLSANPSLLQNLPLIPDQTKSGQFRTIGMGIHSDPGITELLKDVLDTLSESVREKLADKGVSKAVLAKITSLSEEQVVKDGVDFLKKKAEEKQYKLATYERANLGMFYWLAKNKKFATLEDNFPVLTHQKELKEQEYISHLLADQPFLKPSSTWDEDALRHVQVFPEERILSDIYSGPVLETGLKLEADDWTSLAGEGIVFEGIFTEEEVELDEETIEKLLEEGELTDEDHSGLTPQRMKSIVLIDLQQRGIHAARKTKTKTTQFLDFVLSYVITHDDSWNRTVTVACSCTLGSHNIRPAKWLYLMKKIEWVWLKKDKEDPPTNESLAPYFQPGGPLIHHLNEDLAIRFLGVLGISTLQMMISSQKPQDKYVLDKSFTGILLAAKNNPAELSRFAEILQNPSLKQKMDESYQAQKDAERNRKIGKIVEDTIRGLLGGALPGDSFKVSKVPDIVGGADVRIDVDTESDLLDEESRPQKLEIEIQASKLYVEVKSTRRDFVRITMPQAKASVSSAKSHLVCVVEIPPNFDFLGPVEQENLVKNDAVFLVNLGPEVEKRLDNANEIKGLERKVREAPEDDIAVDLIQGSIIRVRLKRILWTGGKIQTVNFTQLVEFLKSVAGASAAIAA